MASGERTELPPPIPSLHHTNIAEHMQIDSMFIYLYT
jgi:hypothetical protein